MCSTCSLDISLQCTDLCPPLCLIPLPQSPSPFAIHSENTIINVWLRTQEGSQEASLYEKRMFWVVHETGSVDTVEIFENFCSRPMNCNACVSEVDAHHLWTLLFSSQGSGNLLWVFFCFCFVWGFVLLLLCFVFFCDFSPPLPPFPLALAMSLPTHYAQIETSPTNFLVWSVENVQNLTTSINTLTSPECLCYWPWHCSVIMGLSGPALEMKGIFCEEL